MTVDTTRPPALPAPAAGPAEKGRFSLEALRESRPARAVIGLLVAAGTVALIYVIVLAFTGHFTDVVKINAELPAGSNAVPIGAPVEYLNVTVGKVGSEGQAPDGSVAVKFFLYPAKMVNVPRGVTAQVEPLSIFGDQYINLVKPAQIGSEHVVAGDFIGPYRGAPSSSLQGTVTQLYSLLHAVHPADLDTALTAFATALNGDGKTLGQALVGGSKFLGAVSAHLPAVQSDLRLTDPVSHEIAAATPDILGILSNSTVTGPTITAQADQLRTLLKSGAATVGDLYNVLSQVDSTLPLLLNQSGPLLADVTQTPDELAVTLNGLGQFASAVANAERLGADGRGFLSVNANLPVANISAGVDAALGYNNPASVDQALGSAVNPSTYTASNCPEYPGESNPFCGVGGSPDAQPVGSASAPASAQPAPTQTQPLSARAAPSGSAGNPGSAPVSPYAAELQAVQAIATGLNGGQAPESSGLASLVLLPLLQSLVGS